MHNLVQLRNWKERRGEGRDKLSKHSFIFLSVTSTSVMKRAGAFLSVGIGFVYVLCVFAPTICVCVYVCIDNFCLFIA